MKLAIVFEVPDGSADALLHTGVQIIEMHGGLKRQGKLPDFWTFDGSMLPVAVAMAETDAELVTAVDRALSTAS